MKTASTAIETALKWAAEIAVVESHAGKHQPFWEIATRFAWVFETTSMDQFFKFGVVRDPIEYMISLYNSHMHQKFKNDPELYTGNLDFDEFLRDWVPYQPSDVIQQHRRFRDVAGNIGVNYIISYDKLLEGLQFVEGLVGVPGLTMLGKENVSYGSLRSSSLTSEQRAQIEDLCTSDRDVLDNCCNRLLAPWSRPDGSGTAPSIDIPLASYGEHGGPENSECGRPVVSEEAFVRALYRTLLLREPDTPGLLNYVTQMRNGQSLENLLGVFLMSPEFKYNKQRFLDTYLLGNGEADEPVRRHDE